MNQKHLETFLLITVDQIHILRFSTKMLSEKDNRPARWS